MNNSSTVSTLDISLINRLILGLTNRLPAGLWKFVRSDFVFPNPEQPWVYDPSRVYTDLAGSLTGQDFIAIKLGDVNSSWAPPGGGGSFGSLTMPSGKTQGNQLTSPAAKQVVFKVATVNAKPREVVRVPITVEGFGRVTSVQFTLRWDPTALRLDGTSAAALPNLSAENYGIARSRAGVLTFAWDSGEAAGVTLRDGTTIFTMRFEVLASGEPETSIEFADEPTLREVTVDAAPAIFLGRDGTVRK